MEKKYIRIDMSKSDNDKVFEFFNSIKESVKDYYQLEEYFITSRKRQFFNIDITNKQWNCIDYCPFSKEELVFVDFSEVIDIPAFIQFLGNLLNKKL